MGTIVIHAGMSKTGSSAIQGHLSRCQTELATAGVVVAVGRPAGAGARVEVFGDGPINSGDLVPHLRDPAAGSRAAASLAGGLDRLADDHPCVVLTGEAFEQTFWRPDREVLEAFRQLSGRHHVRVAYYVRPQHTALEAAWRQWGFRSGRSPAAYVRDRAETGDRYHYLSTLRRVRQLAPEIDFGMRPFRRDLLVGGDVVADFMSVFLPGEIETPGTTRDDNVGLALDLVNVLQTPGGTRLWASPHQNRLFNRVKQLLRDVDGAPSDAALRGRDVLQAWCHDAFEEQNQALLHELGWQTASWVPAVPDTASDLALLDELWGPPAVPAVVDALVTSLEAHVAGDDGPRPPATRRPRTLPNDDQDDELRQAYERLRAEHERLRQRRSVRAALRLSELARPPFVRRFRRH